jgi:hypothetical protein
MWAFIIGSDVPEKNMDFFVSMAKMLFSYVDLPSNLYSRQLATVFLSV